MAAIWTLSAGTSAGADASGVTIREHEGKLRIEIGGQLFSEYYYQNVPGVEVTRPFLYPIIGPGGARMTRNWPIVKDAPNEERDHPHHRSLWYAHGAINGVDFWAEGRNSGKTVHEKFIEVKSGPDVGVIKSLHKLVAQDGTIVGTDERTIRIFNRTNERIFDYEITVHASHGKLTFGDTKEGAMAMRLAETMRLKGKVGQGHIVNSEGVRDGETWGQRAKWVDYHGPVDGKLVGVAIFDHPDNPRHPTWWHVRDYGLFAANPFGVHDFEKLPDKHKGDMEIPAGKSVTFRYRFYLHEGDEKQGQVAQRYEEYARAAGAPQNLK